MTTTKLPDTVLDAQLLILDGLHEAHHFLPLKHFSGTMHPRLLHEAVFNLASDRRVHITNGHLHLAAPTTDGQDVTATAAEQIVRILAAEHHPRTAVWIELALPVELAPAVEDALTVLVLDGRIAVRSTAGRPYRFYLT
ncbi:hypothetical protein [Mycolicibacter icosiumassiliensis]|uniref:hypothetical protein n=1 Tax=Mycolicibacter icosiumassiliensis TaxID=1792835 RepID=UPI000837A0CF|nr:hypothetical protein [Mycolicibacter icosiumassiliensis]